MTVHSLEGQRAVVPVMCVAIMLSRDVSILGRNSDYHYAPIEPLDAPFA